MNDQQLRQALHELAAQGVPPDMDLWPALEARVARRRRAPWARLLPATRLGWAGLGLAILLAVGATVHATAPEIIRLLLQTQDGPLGGVDVAHLGQPLDLSQTMGNVTVTLQWAYADADRILIGYTIRSSDRRRYDPRDCELTDALGEALLFAGGYGVTGQSDIMGVTLPPGEGSYVYAFAHKAALPPVGQALKLRFALKVEELVLPTGAGSPTANPTDTTGGAPPYEVQLEPLPPGATLGPFVFELSIPMSARSPR